MPVVSSFYGILIYFYFEDHNPPHFHARYNEYEALIDINTEPCFINLGKCGFK